MTRFTLPLLLLCFTVPTAVAQPGIPAAIEIPLAPWLATGDWPMGLGFAVVGATGAVVTMYFLIGGSIPGTPGERHIDSTRQRLGKYYRTLDDLMESKDLSPRRALLIEKVSKAIDELRDDIQSEQNRQYATGTLMFVLVGAVIAALLAQNFISALAAGAGWTGIVGGILRLQKTRKADGPSSEPEPADEQTT